MALEHGSHPVHEVRIERNVYAPMRDGTKLAVDLYLPDTSGRFPALLSMHPYCKATEDTLPLAAQLRRFSVEYAGVEAGDHFFWPARGYVHAIADVRGCGNSEGTYHGLFSPQEQQDGYDLVEWVAAQEWCDGNVGMIGISYLAIIQYLVAAQQPPHLRAIFPHDGWGDLYRDIMYHGGIPTVFWHVLGGYIAANRAVSAAQEMYDETDLTRTADALLADAATSYAKNPVVITALRTPQARPISFDTLVQPEDGPYWRERSPVHHMHKIKVPTYLGAEMHAYPTAMHLPGVSWGWDRIAAPKKVAFRPTPPSGGLDRPFYEFHDEMLRWFDHWLKGFETGIMDEPAVKIWVRGRDEYRFAEEWPLLSITEWSRFYLREGGRLTREEPQVGEQNSKFHYEPVLPSVINPYPLGQPNECLTYVTEPFERDTEVTGPLALYLSAALSSTDGHFVIAVKEVASDGAEHPLSRGWLRASHRALDPSQSAEWRPFHPHDRSEPLTPGGQYEFAIEIQPLANLFRQGTRLKLEIWPGDHVDLTEYDWTMFWGACHHIPYGKPVDYDVFHAPEAPSYLLLPIISQDV